MFILMLILFSLFALFINIAVALYLSSVLGNSYGGFFVVAGFYLLLIIVFKIGKNRLVHNPIRNFIVSQILNNE